MGYSQYSYVPSSIFGDDSRSSSSASARTSKNMVGSSQNGALSVTQALFKAKNLLEGLSLCVIGEVSEVNAKAGYAAVYFSIKDAKSTLPCKMWNDRYRANGLQLKVGMRVFLTGCFSVYPAKGSMSFDVTSIKLDGEGELRRQVADIARRLNQEGLTSPEVKMALPYLPHKVGVVTSPRGDAIHDVLRTLRRRFPLVEVVVAGVPVEGPNVVPGMISALECLARTDCEVILLVRGGGSFEALMPFNDESLARAVRACPKPIVTGIGHEPDTTICDMVADLRASTPTGAAEAVVPTASSILSVLESQQFRIQRIVQNDLDTCKHLVDHVETRPIFKDPRNLYAIDCQMVDYMQQRLSCVLPHVVQVPKCDLEALQARLIRVLPRITERPHHEVQEYEARMKRALPYVLDGYTTSVSITSQRLKRVGTQVLGLFENEFIRKASRLEDLSPLAILKRGYAMAQNEQGMVVSSVSDVKPDDTMCVSVSDGTISCLVTSTQSGELH